MRKTPPKWATRLIMWYSHPDYTQEIAGDLQELFSKWVEEKGLFQARIHYILNAILFMRIYNRRSFLGNSKLNQSTMLPQAVKLSLRNICKYKVYNIGNIFGLAVGIAICLMIFSHANQELSYEKKFPNHSRIFRISTHNEWAKSPPTLAEELDQFFPELESVCRFARYGGNAMVIANNDKRFMSNEAFQVDQSAIDIFNFKFLRGTSDGALERPYTTLINATTALKLFGNDNPVGQTLEINEREQKYEITGVIEDLPQNSHLKADVLVSMPTFYKETPLDWTDNRGWMVMYTYTLLDREENLAGFYKRMPDFQDQYLPEEIAENLEASGRHFEIMALTDIHLRSNRIQEMRANSNMSYIYIFSTLAFFIIVIGCVNFINIFTTLAFKRVKEVGLRKVVGASRAQVVFQLLTEACVTAVIAATLGLVVCLLALPYYNRLVDLSISYADLLQPVNLTLLLGLAIGLGLVSGLYPALLVTKRKLTEAMLSSSNPKASISMFRKGLIVFQFALSLFILIGTVVINEQMDYIQNKDLGYSTEHLASVRLYGNLQQEIHGNIRTTFASLKSNANIRNVALASNLMGEPLSVEGFVPVDADSEQEFPSANMIWVDENYVETLGIEISKGRNFQAKTDTAITFLVNEQLAKLWGIDVVGEMAEFRGEKGPIVGVIKDINYYSLHSQIEPMVICHKPGWTSNLLVKIGSEGAKETLQFIENELKEKSPQSIIRFSFMDDKLQELYKSENNMFFVFKVFSLLALILSCVGLLGIAAIEVQRRTKEVGIRKVLGASGKQILALLSGQFVIMLALAIVLSVPLSFFSVKEWLADYSYSITLSGWEFILPSLGLLLMALLVITLHSIKAMNANPTKSLRSE